MNRDTIQGQFEQFIGAAKSQWGRLTDDDFLAVRGDIQKLKGVVQERYGITVDEANEQVKKWQAHRPHDIIDRSGS